MGFSLRTRDCGKLDIKGRTNVPVKRWRRENHLKVYGILPYLFAEVGRDGWVTQ